MSAHGADQTPVESRTAHLAIYGAAMGLISIGVGGLSSWIAYGSPDPTRRVVPMLVIFGLIAGAGLSANRVVTWLTALWREVRDSPEGRVSSPSCVAGSVSPPSAAPSGKSFAQHGQSGTAAHAGCRSRGDRSA